jgi:nucleotide-binding universal stress UspA family protein
MITIQRILCPMDLSSESDEALSYGVALASAYNAKLLLLYCKEVCDAPQKKRRKALKRLFNEGED